MQPGSAWKYQQRATIQQSTIYFNTRASLSPCLQPARQDMLHAALSQNVSASRK